MNCKCLQQSDQQAVLLYFMQPLLEKHCFCVQTVLWTIQIISLPTYIKIETVLRWLRWLCDYFERKLITHFWTCSNFKGQDSESLWVKSGNWESGDTFANTVLQQVTGSHSPVRYWPKCQSKIWFLLCLSTNASLLSSYFVLATVPRQCCWRWGSYLQHM